MTLSGQTTTDFSVDDWNTLFLHFLMQEGRSNLYFFTDDNEEEGKAD